MTASSKPHVILLMGPTAAGKTALSLELAAALQTEIISVDSALVYRGMDIGTAKPSISERQQIHHHLIDILEPTETFSTGQFRDRAYALIDDMLACGRTPILTGGTMLYFSALTQGLAQLPAADPAIRQVLEDEMALLGKQAMHDKLAAIDPEAAARIHVNDPQRIQRALEVYAITGKPLSRFFAEQQTTHRYSYQTFIIAPSERQQLHQRIEQRFLNMLAEGLIDEVKQLRQDYPLDLSLPAMRCVGYRQVWHYLEGEIDYPTLIEQGVAASRQLAKRQLTWLRKEQQAHWLDSAADNLPQVLQHLAQA